MKYADHPTEFSNSVAIEAPVMPIQLWIGPGPELVGNQDGSLRLLVTKHSSTSADTAATITATTSFQCECLADLPFLFLSKVVPSDRQKFMSSSW